MRSIVALLLTLPVLLLAAPAASAAAFASPDDAPAVSIAVSDGREEAAAGDRLRYTVEVENAGGQAFSGSVILRVPDFVEVEASGATVEGSIATWNLEIPAGGSAKWEAAAIVGDAPGDAYQVVVLAEVADGGGAVVVRAADADAIPGAPAPPAVAGMTGAGPGLAEWMIPAGILSTVILAGTSVTLLGVVLARRSRPRMG